MKHFYSGQNCRIQFGKSAFTQNPFAFSFPPSQIVAIAGKNGSGKSTFLRALAGEREYLSGQLSSMISMQGEIAFVSQEAVAPPNLTLRSLLGFAFLPQMGNFRALSKTERVDIEKMAEHFEISRLLDVPLQRMSTGEKQRSMLARALLQKPRLLLLDEPTNHLDPGSHYTFWNQLKKFQEVLKVEIVLSTHDLDLIQRECGWVFCLENGNKFFEGPKIEFLDKRISEKIYGKHF